MKPIATWPRQRELCTHLQLTPWLFLPVKFDHQACLNEGLKLVAADRYELTSADHRTSEIVDLYPQTFNLIDALTDIEACKRILFMLLEPGAEITVHSDAPDQECALALNVALNMPSDCEFWVDLEPDGSLNCFSRPIPIQPGAVFLFNSATCHRVVNRSHEPRLHLVIHGPLRFSTNELVALARRQNSLHDHRHALNNLLGKKGRLGENLRGTALHLDLNNVGTRREMLPATFALGLAMRAIGDESLQEEAVAVTRASLHPMVAETLPLTLVDEWLRQKWSEGKEFAIVLESGCFLGDPLEFMIEALATTAQMERCQTMVVGHVLDKQKGELPALHEKFFVLNLKRWHEWGEPRLSLADKGLTDVFPAFEPSGLHYFDNFTPTWLQPMPHGEPLRGQSGFGTKALVAQLNQGHRIHSVPESLRRTFDYMNPRQGRGENYHRVQHRIKNYLSAAQERVFVFNTENLAAPRIPFAPNVIISPCAGLKPMVLFSQLVRRPCRFLFIENNPRALRFYCSLLSCRNYAEVLSVQHEALAAQGLAPPSPTLKMMMEEVLSQHFSSSASEFMHCLKQVGAQAAFLEADYLSHHELIVQQIQPEDELFFWHSNAWETNSALFRATTSQLRRNYRQLVTKFSERMGLSAWIHKNGFAATLGTSVEQARVALVEGSDLEPFLEPQSFAFHSSPRIVLELDHSIAAQICE